MTYEEQKVPKFTLQANGPIKDDVVALASFIKENVTGALKVRLEVPASFRSVITRSELVNIVTEVSETIALTLNPQSSLEGLRGHIDNLFKDVIISDITVVNITPTFLTSLLYTITLEVELKPTAFE